MNYDYSKKSDKKIIEMFNFQVRINVLTHTRSLHLAWIRKEFVDRWFDYSIVGDNNSMSYMNKIELININWIKTIVINKDDLEIMPFHLNQINKNSKLTDIELIERFNSLVNQWWHRNVVIMKDMLRWEITNRWFDFSELWIVKLTSIMRYYTTVSEIENFAFNNKVKLVEEDWVKIMKIIKNFRLYFIRKWVYWWYPWYWIYLINNTNDSYKIDYDTGWYYSDEDQCHKLIWKKKQLEVSANSNVIIEESDIWALDFVWYVDLILKWKSNYSIHFDIWKWAPSWELKNIEGFDSKWIEMNFGIKCV